MADSTLIDSHCHLDAPEFNADRAAVIARAQAAGVVAQVIPAVRAADFAALRALCAAHAGLYPAYGLHPCYIDEHLDAHLEEVDAYLRGADAVAVGECGLDFFSGEWDPERQQRVFAAQLDLALRHDLPLILHARRATEAVLLALKARPGLRGVVHSYSGSAEQARELDKLGFKLGFGGPLTYERAQRLRRLVAELPLSQILIESDAPDQPNADRRGQRNEPAFLGSVLAQLAAIRGLPAAELAAITCENARQLFGLH